LFVVLSSVRPFFRTTTKIIIFLSSPFTASTLLFPVHLLVDIFTTTLPSIPLPTSTMEGPLEQVLEHPKSPDFIDAAASGFTYDSLAGLDYLQYPHTEAFGMPSIHRT
jgi:hypothetical protein